jgi:hypothetical protein
VDLEGDQADELDLKIRSERGSSPYFDLSGIGTIALSHVSSRQLWKMAAVAENGRSFSVAE